MKADINTHIHRNVTFKRLILDFYQYLRSQRILVSCLGRQHHTSLTDIEIDITYRCNLRCVNCNRSCTQAPSKLEMAPEQIASFVDESLARQVNWKRIRLLGGEPTLHSDFGTIVDLLLDDKKNHNSAVRIVVCTNGHGRRVRLALSRLPSEIIIKSTYKKGVPRLFRPFNMAPVDSRWYHFADYASGCRILKDCGLGFTPMGYYPCAISGGIDRIFGLTMGRTNLPSNGDNMLEMLRRFCPLCGHFGFGWPTKRIQMSPVWKKAYGDHKN